MFTTRINYLRFSLIILRKTVYFIVMIHDKKIIHIYTVLSDLGKKSAKYKGSK